MTVQARTQWGAGNIDLAHELEKEIAFTENQLADHELGGLNLAAGLARELGISLKGLRNICQVYKAGMEKKFACPASAGRADAQVGVARKQ